MKGKPTILVLVNNHFDPTWRRCFRRRFEDRGLTYASYAEIEQWYVEACVELCARHSEAAFEIESVIVAREVLNRRPDLKEPLRALARQRRFAVCGAGEAIIDGNLVLGESLVRNFTQGLAWVEDELGQKTVMAVRNDAFGNPAQLPQIIRACGIQWATGMSYTAPTGNYWRGLDDSTILVANLPIAAWGGGFYKYPPCPSCRGTGFRSGQTCQDCGGRGIPRTPIAALPASINESVFTGFGAARAVFAPEELLPNPEMFAWAAGLRDRYEIRFGTGEEALPFLKSLLDKVDDPPPGQLHDGVELNPNNDGCWVTRIRTKQACRRQEHALLGLESLCAMAACGGAPWPGERLQEIWRRLHFTQFHDAITGTHIDAAAEELEEERRAIDAATEAVRAEALARLVEDEPEAISVVNPRGSASTQVCSITLPFDRPPAPLVDDAGNEVTLLEADGQGGKTTLTFVAREIPALGARTYRLSRATTGGARSRRVRVELTGPGEPTEPSIENGRFQVRADENGIICVYDKRLGITILKADRYRPGELVLEHDEGSPWMTMCPFRERTPLAASTKLAAAERGPGWQRLVFQTKAPPGSGLFAPGCLAARTTVTVREHIERVDFSIEADWEAFNHRLRVAFPVPFGGRSMYEVPYGILERREYGARFAGQNATGDWPALNWAGVEGHVASVAVFNKGLPSYRIEHDASPPAGGGAAGGRTVLVSLLRSPAVPHYLHEPQYYTMQAYDGMRDAGHHRFELAVASYLGPFSSSEVVADAECYNAGLVTVAGRARLPGMPSLRSECARLSCVKMADKGTALVLRLCEVRGIGGGAVIALPDGARSAAEVDLRERHVRPLAIRRDGTVSLDLRPWQIATLAVEA